MLRSVALALAGCAGLAPIPPTPPSLDGVSLGHFYRVDADVYRSAQPSASDLLQLAQKYGIRSVLKLNDGKDSPPPGVVEIDEPLNSLHEPDPATLDRILGEIDAAPKPLLIHCTHGQDRTGLIVALYRMRHGVSADASYAEMVRNGFHPYAGLWSAWLRRSAWGQPTK